MKNADIAHVLNNLADLLELKGESPFRIRAYQRAAHTIMHYPVEMETLAQEDRLREVPGIGESIAAKIDELLDSGRVQLYEDLKHEFSESVIGLTEVPGIGPKTAVRLVKELNVSNLADLEAALRDGRVAALPRMGEKTAENLLRHLQTLRTKERRIPLGVAVPLVREVLAALASIPGVHNVTAAGSLRRMKETIGDIDLMGTAADPERVARAFAELPQVVDVLGQGPTKASVIFFGDMQADLRIVEDDRFGSLLQYFTGSKEHNVTLRERAIKQGLKLSEYGIATRDGAEYEKFPTEEAFYARLGLEWMPPEIREDRGEIEAAASGRLPHLIEIADVRGDLHVHTTWSDGNNSVAEMAEAARARGYEYIAICDHSVGRGIAHGLSEEALRQQIAEIEALNRSLSDFRVLCGSEVDIRADGSLDLPDHILAQLDIVVASVHSAMGQDEARMTERIIGAVRNPHVDIIGHPTCRLLLQREPVAVDMEAIFAAARATGTALEINADPYRLDLNDVHVFRARELGIRLVINTDAHRSQGLDHMQLGVAVARRGWCERSHILNTLPLDKLLAALKPRLERAPR